MEYPLFQFVSIASHPVMRHHWEESGSLFLTLPVHIRYLYTLIRPSWASGSISVPSVLQAKPYQFSQPLLIWRCSSGLPLYVCVSCTEEPSAGPTTPDVSHQDLAEEKVHLSSRGGNAAGRKLLAFFAERMHFWLMVSLVSTRPRVFLSRAVFYLIGIQPVQLSGVVSVQVHNFVELHEIPVDPFF